MRNAEGPLRDGGGSPNNTMMGEDFMPDKTLAPGTAVTQNAKRGVLLGLRFYILCSNFPTNPMCF
jgi:hypothetical protein